MPLDISVELWIKIIRGTTINIKRMLQCYLQVTEPNKRVPLQEIEKRLRGRSENGLWVWEPRPEVMKAAEIVLREENFPPVQFV